MTDSPDDDVASLNEQITKLSLEGNLKEAIPIAQQVVEIQTRVHGSQPPRAQALNNLGLLYRKAGRFDQATELFREALEIDRRALGPEHPDSLSCLNNLALVLLDTERYREALDYFRVLLASQQKILGPDHPDTASTLKNLALVNERIGDGDQVNQQAERTQETAGKPSPMETPRKKESRLRDPAPLHIDTPAIRDQLGREVFTYGLAYRLRHIWNENTETKSGNSFVLHLHGPWGSGKSTLLNMLKRQLQPEVPGRNGADARSYEAEGSLPRSVVIDFNAWQNQRLDPPWWPLVDTVYRQGYAQLSGHNAVALRFRELRWRFITGNFENVLRSSIILIVTAVIAALVWRFWPNLVGGGSNRDGKMAVDTSKAAISTITALAGVLGAISSFFSRPLLSGSARAAQTFVQSAIDPMAKVQRHFQELITWINHPVVIFIDDLDRCKSECVVSLLEGIQTLFNDRRVIYVISADRRWLYCCFEKAYDQFKASVNELGRGLGYLFVEKAVQLSVAVPRLSPGFQAAYWDYLVNRGPQDVRSQIEGAAKEARSDLGSAMTEEDMAAKLKPDADPIRTHARREEAIIRLSTEEAVIMTEYFLKQFALLLEPNPRAMKRLLNAYGVKRDEAILAGVPVLENLDKRKQMALWTIVCLRWPELEEVLVRKPEYADVLCGLQPGNSIPGEMQTLFDNEEVKKVFRGDGVNVLLDKLAVEHLTAFRTAKSELG